MTQDDPSGQNHHVGCVLQMPRLVSKGDSGGCRVVLKAAARISVVAAATSPRKHMKMPATIQVRYCFRDRKMLTKVHRYATQEEKTAAKATISPRRQRDGSMLPFQEIYNGKRQAWWTTQSRVRAHLEEDVFQLCSQRI